VLQAWQTNEFLPSTQLMQGTANATGDCKEQKKVTNSESRKLRNFKNIIISVIVSDSIPIAAASFNKSQSPYPIKLDAIYFKLKVDEF
jgi:hypothetical protein